MDAPVFVIGVARSGTTLMRFMLNSGGRIYIPGESEFIPRFFLRDPDGTLTMDRVEQMLTVIRANTLFYQRWPGPDLTASAVMSAMRAPTPASFIDVVYSEYARGMGARRWGDKTPIYTNHVPLLADLFPDAKFVHIVRDGRDVALSTQDKWGAAAHVDVYFAARSWAERTQNVTKAARHLPPQRIHQLRYEDLIADPEHHLRAICAFLDEPYDARMAQPHLLGRELLTEEAFSAPVRQPPDPSRQQRWRTEMSVADQRLVQHVAGAELGRHGYDLLDLGGMPPRERTRLAGLAMKYRAGQAVRRVLVAAGRKHPN